MAKRPSSIRLIEAGKTYQIAFNDKGWVSQVDMEVEKKKRGLIVQTLWRRGGGEKPLSERSAAAMERAIALREQARWDEESNDWTYPGKA